ncbi:putative transcription factor bZIP family [Lupinus albus]|uniref:Putative transcription factor bZIP family n=1 Tax=Lupinus albus TaxID=3870 RepID=A0A6A4P1V2_LUPAL|nr:putative transcription factor bZIP family [Lupinus albus]
MEEVWKDINLASLNEQNTRPSMSKSSAFGGVIFQDFLSIDPSSNTCSNTRSLYSPAPQTPLTALSLSCSRPQFHFDSSLRSSKDSHFLHPQHPNNPNPKLSSFPTIPPTTTTATTTTTTTPFESKRFAEPPDFNPGERRNKRMIKNRESAARSRARKQAYTKELQLKVDLLQEENERLKRQQQQLYEAAAANQKKKNTLYRTSTAPF